MACKFGMIKKIFIKQLLFFYVRPLNYAVNFSSVAALHCVAYSV